MAIVLAAAYWFDGIIPGIRTANPFDPTSWIWTETVAKLAAALAVAGLGWLLFAWSPPSRLTGLFFALVGGLLLLTWQIALSFHLDLPGFAFLNLYTRLGTDGLLNLVAPFLTALGLVRVIWPVRGSGPGSAPRRDGDGG